MNTTSFAINKPPRVKGLPFLGSTLKLMKDPLQFCVEEYEKHGPVFEIKTLFNDIVVMAGLESNQFLSREAKDYLVWPNSSSTGVARPKMTTSTRSLFFS